MFDVWYTATDEWLPLGLGLGAIRQQAITLANVNPDLYRQMASLGLNELTIKYTIIWYWQRIHIKHSWWVDALGLIMCFYHTTMLIDDDCKGFLTRLKIASLYFRIT